MSATTTHGPTILRHGLVFSLDAKKSTGEIKTPGQLSGLVCWIDAADSSSISGSAGDIFVVNDKSSNGYKLIPANSGAYPAYVTSSEGQYCIRTTYVGPTTSKLLYTDQFNLSTSDFTVFAAFQQTNDSSTTQRVVSGNGNNWLLGFWSSYEDQCYFNNWIHGSGAGSPFNLIPIQNITKKIYTGRGMSDNTNILFRRNGINLRSGSVTNDGPNGLILGGGYLSASIYTEVSNSDIYEVIVYNRALSDLEVSRIEKYLGDKWHIPISLQTVIPQIISGSLTATNSPAYYDDSLILSGEMAYINTGKKWTDLISPIQTASISFATWIRPWKKDTGGSYGSVIHQLEGLTVPNTSSRGGFHLKVDASLNAAIDFGTNQFYHTVTSATKLRLGQWSHVVGVRNGFSQSLYINGVLDTTSIVSSGSWLNASTTNIVIGRGWSSDLYKFNGDIGSVHIYDTPLTADNVSYLYNQHSSKYNYKNTTGIVENGLVMYVDAGNIGSYPNTGNTIYNLTGSQNFNFTSSGIVTGSVKFFDCGGSYGILKRSGSVETALGSDITIIAWAIPLSSTGNWRTLCRGWSYADHHFIVQSGGHAIGFYDSGTAQFFSSGYSITSISNYQYEYNSYEVVLSSTSPEWTFYLNGESDARGSIPSASIASANFGIGMIGGYTTSPDNANPILGSSQYFGTIGCFMVYNRKLTHAERRQNYMYFKSRFGK